MSATAVRGVADLRVDGAPSQWFGTGPAGAWALTDDVLVRRATLPGSALTRLRSPALAEVAALSQEREEVARTGRELADALHPVIGASAEPTSSSGSARGQVRGALIGARRALHVGRPLTNGERAALPPGLQDRVATWQRDLIGLTTAEGDLDGRLADDLAHDLPRLLEAGRSPYFRHALALAAGSLVTELDKLEHDPGRRLKTAKKVRLVKFLARAAGKASPYSSFLATNAEHWSGTASGTSGPTADLGLTRQLDQARVTRLVQRLTEEARARGTARVRTNPTLCRSEGVLLLLGGAGDTPASLPDHPGVGRWIALVDDLAQDGGTDPTLRQVRAAARDSGLDPADLERVAAVWVLEVFAPVDDVDPRPVAGLRRWLCSTGEHWARQEADRLGVLDEELSRPGPLDDGTSHRALLALAERLTASPVSLDQSRAREIPAPAAPDSAVHEVLLGGEAGAGPDVESWRSSCADLDVARRWLALFSWKHPVRVVLATWVRERFGRAAAVPLITALAALRRELSQGPAAPGTTGHLLRLLLSPGAMPWFLDLAVCEDPRLVHLHRLRQDALQQVDRAVETGAGPELPQVRLDPRALADQLAGLPGWVTGCPSVACYLQVVPEAPGSVVLNAMHLGMGRARSRHAGLTSGAVLRADAGHGPMEAELAGHFGSSMNARVPTLPFVIETPGTVSTRPRAQRLAPGRLELRHDPATDLVRLWSPAHDREVVPYHVGMMGEMGLSPFSAFLDRALSPSFVVHASVSLLGAASLPTLEGLRREPRVSVGSVVVQRARLTTPAERIPVGRCGRVGAADLLALARWRREHGVPEVCYVRTWSADQHSLDHKGRKPLLVDFQNWYTVEAFAAQVRAADVVVVEEAYPDPVRPGASDEALTELMVEIGDADGAVA